MTNDHTRTLLVAESDPALRRLLVYRLAAEGFDVVEVAEPSTVAAKISIEDPDMVLLEMAPPNGHQLLTELRRLSDAAVIALLWPTDDADPATVLDLGADDCLARPLYVPGLMSRVRAVLRRTRSKRTRRLNYDSLDIDLAGRRVAVGRRPVELATREFDLLAYLASHPNDVFTRDQLLTAVWQSSADWQQPATVTEHVHRLRTRLEDDPTRPRWLLAVRGVGYRLAP